MAFGRNSSSKMELESSLASVYPNSMDNSSHSSATHNCTEETEENLEKDARKLSSPCEIRTFKKRFVMLFLASFCSMMNGVPLFQYTVVADIISCFYGVTVTDVNWTCVVFMMSFIPLVFPVMYFMDRKGLRSTVLVAGFLNCVAGWIQCASFKANRYGVIMTSQTIYAVAEVFLLSLPPYIAGVWFGPGEVGLACAFGVFGNQLGIAIGFIIPPMFLDNNCKDKVDISHELSIIAYPVAVINTITFIILLIVFQEKPALYPSIAQANKKKTEKPNYIKSLKNLVKSVPFILLLLSYGLITGTFLATSSIINEMVLSHFPGAEVDAGWMGAIVVFSGMAGSIFLGAALDKTHRFKEISLMACCASFLLMACYTGLILLETALWVQFVFFSLLGFITAGYLPVGFDFAAEITYPEPEAMSGSLLNLSSQIFSIILIDISSSLIQTYGDIASNLFFCSCLFLGIFTTASVTAGLQSVGNAGVIGSMVLYVFHNLYDRTLI